MGPEEETLTLLLVAGFDLCSEFVGWEERVAGCEAEVWGRAVAAREEGAALLVIVGLDLVALVRSSIAVTSGRPART